MDYMYGAKGKPGVYWAEAYGWLITHKSIIDVNWYYLGDGRFVFKNKEDHMEFMLRFG